MRGSSWLSTPFLAASILTLGCTVDSTGSREGALHRDGHERPEDAGFEGCTFGLGYWKNHEEDWPVAELDLGNRTYTQAELLETLRTPVRGNGLVSMSHHLITAKLNIANGADPGELGPILDEADALIGDLVVPPIGDGYLVPKVASGFNGILGDLNGGVAGPGPCEDDEEEEEEEK